MERRLAEIPTEDWGRRPGPTSPPREYVLDLPRPFLSPVQLYEPFTDSEGQSLFPARVIVTASRSKAVKPFGAPVTD